MKAVISGGGIAGLAAGTALRRRGIEVEIFERAPELREIGAGLMIWPNGARSLHALSVEIDALSLHTLSVCTWRGRQLSRYPLNPIAQRFGTSGLTWPVQRGRRWGWRSSYATVVQPGATFW